MPEEESDGNLTSREKYTLGVLCIVNVFNYMDRLGVAGLLIELQAYFEVGDDLGGLLQSALIISYLLSAPVFGYLSDRYSRCLLLMLCTGLWSTMVVLGSFCEHYWQFILCRAIMGIFQSGFTTIAPTVVGDIVMKNTRSTVLSLFNVAIPLGSGLGYVVSSGMSDICGGWQWGLRVTPLFNYILTVLLYFCSIPNRGEKEAKARGRVQNMKATAYQEDILYLVRNPTFMLLTFGLTAITFVTGAMAWWAPKCLYYGFQMIPPPTKIKFSNLMFGFGSITVVAGILGSCCGTGLSLMLRKFYSWMDPVICGIGFLVALPLVTCAMMTASYNVHGTFILIFFGMLTMNFNWPIVPDILLYVVIPTRRGSAVALQIFIQHAFGDLWSPYIVGALSEKFKSLNFTKIYNTWMHPYSYGIVDENASAEFHSLQISLLCISFIHFMGVLFFITAACFVDRDRREAEAITEL